LYNQSFLGSESFLEMHLPHRVHNSAAMQMNRKSPVRVRQMSLPNIKSGFLVQC